MDKVQAQLPKFFNVLPSTLCTLKAMKPAQAKSAPAAYVAFCLVWSGAGWCGLILMGCIWLVRRATNHSHELLPTCAALYMCAHSYYYAGTADGSRPGVFWANTDNLPARKTYEMEALTLHEAVPGHHLQITLAIESDSLTVFQRHLEDRRCEVLCLVVHLWRRKGSHLNAVMVC
mgnify:CR=1 FL=1